MFSDFDWQQFLGAFFVLFAIIDMPGSIPLVISIRKKGKIIKPVKAAVLAFIMFMIFFWSNPFSIFEDIILRITVYMINFKFFLFKH